MSMGTAVNTIERMMKQTADSSSPSLDEHMIDTDSPTVVKDCCIIALNHVVVLQFEVQQEIYTSIAMICRCFLTFVF